MRDRQPAGLLLLLPEVRDELRSFREGRHNGTITEVPVEERATT